VTMKISTADFPDEIDRYESALEIISRHVEDQKPDLLVLPEMPFTPWVFHTHTFDQTVWDNAVDTHAEWLDRFARDISVPLISSRPTNVDGKRLNQAFYLDIDRKIHPLRSKYYLPNDFPAVEAPWFDVGDKPGEVFDLAGHRIGVQLCSELMYAETPRLIGENGASIIIQARATGGNPRWRAASILAAVTSGAFVIGANRHSVERDWFTGGSWIYSPDGELLTETNSDTPIKTFEIDIAQSKAARSEYPLTMFASY
jgi:predicted amidohydrolase